jgi:hypothetical protein
VPVTRNRDGKDEKRDYDQTRGLKALSAPGPQPLRTTGWVPHGIIVAEPRQLFMTLLVVVQQRIDVVLLELLARI